MDLSEGRVTFGCHRGLRVRWCSTLFHASENCWRVDCLWKIQPLNSCSNSNENKNIQLAKNEPANLKYNQLSTFIVLDILLLYVLYMIVLWTLLLCQFLMSLLVLCRILHLLLFELFLVFIFLDLLHLGILVNSRLNPIFLFVLLIV